MVSRAYDDHKRRMAERSRAKSRDARDIGDIPPIEDPERRRLAELHFRIFCETYLPKTFCLPWSANHLKVIDKITLVVLDSASLAVAMPRGTGKTALCMAAVLWAVLLGHHRSVVFVAATKKLALDMMANVKRELETNDRLLADFPEVCYAIRRLDGETRRAKGQLHHGRRTYIEWGDEKIVLPEIPGSDASGAIIQAASLGSAIRGLNHKTPAGEQVRPTLGLGDDPQTKSSAQSPVQTQKRLEVLTADIAGLAGPGQRVGLLVPCTVVAENDLADTILDQERYPAFRGERTRMVERWPDDDEAVKHWDRYAELRIASQRSGADPTAATEYYRGNRAPMDRGFEVSWTERFDRETELSAQQHAMNLKLDLGPMFEPEYQNESPQSADGEVEALTPAELMGRVVKIERGLVPSRCERLTAFIDVQKKLLWWMVCGWAPGMGGHVVAYGAWPDQGRRYFTKRDAKRTFAARLKGEKPEAQLYHALGECVEHVVGRSYRRDDEAEMRVERCFIDSGAFTDTVFRFCRESAAGSVVMPSKGDGLGPRDIALPDRKKREGVRVGHHWQIQRPVRRSTIHCFYDTNRWKTLVAGRLRAAVGGDQAVTWHAGNQRDHQMLVDHIRAEWPERVEARGQVLEMWSQKPHQDNDLFDCLIGNAVAASTLGVPVELGEAPRPQRKRRGRTRVTV
ncbi:MAG: terminase gpA endonuclease subunit [Planctomycetota bacterium]